MNDSIAIIQRPTIDRRSRDLAGDSVHSVDEPRPNCRTRFVNAKKTTRLHNNIPGNRGEDPDELDDLRDYGIAKGHAGVIAS